MKVTVDVITLRGRVGTVDYAFSMDGDFTPYIVFKRYDCIKYVYMNDWRNARHDKVEETDVPLLYRKIANELLTDPKFRLFPFWK